MSSEKSTRLEKTIEDYRLIAEEDIFSGEEFTIIKRSGISKIRKAVCGQITKKLVHYSPKTAVVWGKIEQMKPDWANAPAILFEPIETFGEVNKENNSFSFYVNVAEKRVESRLVLEAIGLYDYGYRGEDEFPDVKPRTIVENGQEAVREAKDAIKKARKGRSASV